MPALKEDITIEQGASFERVFDCVSESTGLPFNLTGFTIVAEMTGAGLPAFTATGGNGTVQIKLTDEQTALLPTIRTHRTYFVRATAPGAPDSDAYRIAEGVVTISAERK